MKRPELLGASLLPLVLLTAGAADTLLLQRAEGYFRLRSQVTPIVNPNLTDIRKAPQLFRGKAVELKGVVFSLGGANGRALLTLCREATDLPVEVVLPEGTTHASIPELTIGNTVRLLCRVDTDPVWKQGRLVLADAINEDEAGFMESAQGYLQRIQQHPGVAANNPNPVPGKAPLSQLYAEAIQHFRPDIDPTLAQNIASWILKYSKQYDVDSRLIMAMVAQESRFVPTAHSNRGAQGLGQLLPDTARGLGVDPHDPEQNVKGTVLYVKQNLRGKSPKDAGYIDAVKLALASYNAGPGNVRKYNGVPPFRETQTYIRRITVWYHQMLTENEKRLWQP